MEKNGLSSLPLIDELYGAILTENNSKLDHIAEQRSDEFENIRIIMSTPKEGGASLDLDLDIIKKKCPIIVSIFQHDNFFITSAEIAMQSSLTGGKSIVPIDWSFSYDSNFAEKIKNIFLGGDIRDEDKELIRNFIVLKKELSIQTDIFPMIIENVRLRRNHPENDRPRDTIASFKALDYIDWNKFEKDKLYKKSNISIQYLANEFNTNSKYLSRIINEYKKKSFVNYINELRVDFAIKELKANKTLRKYTLFALTKEFGFNSTESFSSAFYKKTTIKPMYFIKELEKDSSLKSVS